MNLMMIRELPIRQILTSYAPDTETMLNGLRAIGRREVTCATLSVAAIGPYTFSTCNLRGQSQRTIVLHLHFYSHILSHDREALESRTPSLSMNRISNDLCNHQQKFVHASRVKFIHCILYGVRTKSTSEWHLLLICSK